MKEFKLSKNEIKPVIKNKGSCIASDKITVDGQKIGFMVIVVGDFLRETKTKYT